MGYPGVTRGVTRLGVTTLDQAGEGLRLPIYRSQVREQLQNQPLFVDYHRWTPPFGRVGKVALIPGFRHTIGYGDGPIFVENNWEGKAFPLHPSAGRFLITVVDSKDQDISFNEV